MSRHFLRYYTGLLIIMFSVLQLTACKDETATEPPAPEEFTVVPYDAVNVVKSNPMKVYAHYMPWFESKDVNGYWGVHWTMANRNPDNIDNDGRREIASHLYPMIGPYSSIDPDLVEYHLLLMKIAGIDGVLIDWYGSHDAYDYRQNRLNSEALIDRLDDTGLQFGIVYEEITAKNVADAGLVSSPLAAAQADLQYMQSQYFSSPQHIQIDNDPLLLTFGPRYFQTPAEWSLIFSGIDPNPRFLTLWGESAEAGSNGSGEFAWVKRDHLTDLTNFYTYSVPQFATAIGSAYPGFYDYYEEGGWGDQSITFTIRYDDGQTLQETMDLALQSGIDMLQLVTWNDFGEGTVIEPTVEFGFRFLELVQQFTGVSYPVTDLQMIYDLYRFRKQFAGDEIRQLKLDQVFYYTVSLQLDKAHELMATIE
jgi:hypothetical protein